MLNRFSDNEWSSGDRDVPTNNRADGLMPDLQGVAGTVARDEFQYAVQTSSAFRSTWLPTQAPISSIVAAGDWRYDFATMDFLAGDSDGDLTAADLDYTMTGVKLELDAEAMAQAPSSSGAVSRDYTQLPAGHADHGAHARQRGHRGRRRAGSRRRSPCSSGSGRPAASPTTSTPRPATAPTSWSPSSPTTRTAGRGTASSSPPRWR